MTERWCEEKMVLVVCSGDCEHCDGFEGEAQP